MTAYEILKYMAWIRGTPRHRIHREVEKWLKRMDLTRYKHVKIKYYSGGTKRKLNTAIAMVIINTFFMLLKYAVARMKTLKNCSTQLLT